MVTLLVIRQGAEKAGWRLEKGLNMAGRYQAGMQVAYIRFNSREDQVRGFYELATKAQLTSLPDGVYGVPWKALALLDEQHISYRRATDAEVPLKHGTIRTPVTPLR